MKKIKLWKNRHELSDKVALVDDEDYEKVTEAIKYKSGKPGKWYAHRPTAYRNTNHVKHYAVNGDRRKAIHRVVMNAPLGMDVDHINGDPLDNRKENLRTCTRRDNIRNSKIRRDSASGFKGVYYVRTPAYQNFLKNGPTLKKDGTPRKDQPQPLAKPWRARMETRPRPGRKHELGHYETAEEAARAYDKKAIEEYGEFANLNFPREEYK
tara:strand:- start:128 stop:757 length:630 start_codon:yes stop_codon:yes gene_type:complete